MAVSNLRTALIRRYRDWRGERKLIDKQIDEITAAYQTLGDKRARAHQVDRLIHSVEIIMAEIAPDWDPATATPTKKHATKIPFKDGQATALALDILRRAEAPITTREITHTMMTEHGLDLEDEDMVDLIAKAVDGTLRKKLAKGLVEKAGEWPVYWSVKDFGDRPSR